MQNRDLGSIWMHNLKIGVWDAHKTLQWELWHEKKEWIQGLRLDCVGGVSTQFILNAAWLNYLFDLKNLLTKSYSLASYGNNILKIENVAQRAPYHNVDKCIPFPIL